MRRGYKDGMRYMIAAMRDGQFDQVAAELYAGTFQSIWDTESLEESTGRYPGAWEYYKQNKENL